MNILIKYDINEELIEDQYYSIKFDYNKITQVFKSFEFGSGSDELIESLDGEEILMHYRGISRIDGKKIFVIDLKQIARNFKFDELGL